MQDKDNENDEECNSALLPQISEGEIGSYNDIHMLEKNNKATAKFTEATLLKTMNEIYRFVKDSEIKKILTRLTVSARKLFNLKSSKNSSTAAC